LSYTRKIDAYCSIGSRFPARPRRDVPSGLMGPIIDWADTGGGREPVPPPGMPVGVTQ